MLPPAWFWTLAVIAIILAPPLIASILELLAEAGRRAVRDSISPAASPGGQAALRPGGVRARVPSLRGTHGSRCDRAHDWPDAGHPPASAGMESVGRFESRPRARRRSARLVPGDVDRPVHRCRHRGLAGGIGARRHSASPAPILFLWFAAPAIAWWISRPLARRARQADGRPDVVSPRSWRARPGRSSKPSSARTTTGCRRTTIRSIPLPRVAHRTSPTNMGLALLANLSAYDFGYSHAGQLIDAHGACASTRMGTLERHEGHFYNWYDTQTLKPLPPLYVSSVDSGNLAGHLLTLRPGCSRFPMTAIFEARLFEGLSDTLAALMDVAAGAIAVPLALFAERPGIGTRCATRHASRSLQMWLARLARIAATNLARRASIPAPEPRATSEAEWLGGRAGRQSPERAGRADVSRALARRCPPARNGSPAFCPPPESRHCASLQACGGPASCDRSGRAVRT